MLKNIKLIFLKIIINVKNLKKIWILKQIKTFFLFVKSFKNNTYKESKKVSQS